ncbi:MAG: type I secretion C-terminal target domain-containing protein, partial [Candidatus Nitrotoga sp.]
PDQIMTGNGGVDVLSGGFGSDTLTGYVGYDILTGGLGSDRFVYNSVNDGTDTITDFTSGAGGDVLDLTVVLGSFTGITPTTHANAFTGGFLQFIASGTDTLVQVDSDGGGDSYISLAVLINTLPLSISTDNYLL